MDDHEESKLQREESALEFPEHKQCPFPVRCFNRLRLDLDDATGFLAFRFGNGAVIMSNIFLSVSLITLGERSTGCEYEDEVCDGTVTGLNLKPSTLIPLIATVTGILSAFLLPIIGAIVDYTKHRKSMAGIFAATLITIQAIQIGTVEATWFPMAILQAINGFIYQGLALCSFAYLPEIRRVVGATRMTSYSSRFYSWMFGMEVVYLIIVSMVGTFMLAGAFSDQYTAQFGQALDVIISGSCYVIAMYFFTPKPARRELPEGDFLIFKGFSQVAKTAAGIVKHYPTTLPKFYLAVLFCESAVNSFSTISVTFLSELGFSGTETGYIFIVVLLSTIPGTFFAKFMTAKLKSPLTSMKICLVVFMGINFAAFLSLTKDNKMLAYPSGVAWGFMLGWFYPTELDMYSTMMPAGQEAELAGFYLYCTQLLGFLPPLIFAIINENPNIRIGFGGVQLNSYLFAGLICYLFLPSWDTCTDIFKEENKMLNNENEEIESEGESSDVKFLVA